MKKRTSKEIFVETLLELSHTMPVNKITVKRIVEESGLSLKTFYNHFPDKYALFSYVEEAEVERVYADMEKDGYSFRQFLQEGVRIYETLKDFINNALQNTSGEDFYGKKHAESAYSAVSRFILKRNNLEALPEDIAFALRLYTYGMMIMTAEYGLHNRVMDKEIFFQYCEENMPEKLKPYLL